MAMFDEESRQTAQKLADVALEYTAQFIAEDYLEEYSRAQRRRKTFPIPRQLDDRMFQIIDKMEKAEKKQQTKYLVEQRIKTLVFAVGCVAIVALGFVLSVAGVREALLVYFGL